MQHRTRHRRIGAALGIGILAAGLAACQQAQSGLVRIERSGELTVVMHGSVTTYVDGPNGPAGFEYDLAQRFARFLGVKLRVVLAARQRDVIPLLRRGKADFAAGLTIPATLPKGVRFGPPYQQVTQQVIYRRGSPAPQGPADLDDGYLEVAAGSAHERALRALKARYPDLHWVENAHQDNEDILERVWQGRVDYAIADSPEAAYMRRYYPELRVAFDLPHPKELAWAFRRKADDSLLRKASDFFRRIQFDGTLAQLIDRYYGHLDDFDYVQTRTFLRHVDSRLPRYVAYFRKAGEHDGLDWRLLAAMAYQESAWNPRAVSPTGVRGIMMLTLATAAHIGVKNRLNPRQSIRGGARYFRHILNEIPDRIAEPDRTWLALAAYNMGFGHLEDARAITQYRGMDPDKWVDVKQNLPLLQKKKWYKSMRYGFARGDEAVTYVERIREYYDQLVYRFGNDTDGNEQLATGDVGGDPWAF